MSAPLPNPRDTVFQHYSLTRIHGTPTYGDIALLERQCRANSQTVRSRQGDGTHGYMGLVSTATAYELVSPGIPFARPVQPILPDLTVAGTTAAQIDEALRIYNEATTIFHTCNLVERTIVQQINTALDDDCLADLINDETGLLQQEQSKRYSPSSTKRMEPSLLKPLLMKRRSWKRPSTNTTRP
jgi:hypothetical protein